MKILFAAGDFDKQLHATNKIVYSIAQKLAEKDHECIFAGVSLFDNYCEETHGNFKTIRLNSSHPCDKAFLALENFVCNSGLTREEVKKKFYLAHPLHTAVLLYRYNISKKPFYSIKSYAKQIRQLAEKEKPDVMVVSYAPFMHAYTLMTEYQWDIPVIAYQLDPWGLHDSFRDNPHHTDFIASEALLFDRCRKIITTPVLLKQYSQHPLYRKYTDRMLALNFPNVAPASCQSTAECAFNFSEDTVNLLFCGILHDEYRNPQILLKQLQSVRNNGFSNFKVHFLGANESETLTRFMSENDWVVHHGNVPLANAFATMAKSDILINIGNVHSNQVPSKIFDYFSFGKPILNVEKLADCPAREYFDKYPLTFTINEHCQCDTAGLSEFISTAKTKGISYSTVENLFADCTLNYATDVFCDIINQI